MLFHVALAGVLCAEAFVTQRTRVLSRVHVQCLRVLALHTLRLEAGAADVTEVRPSARVDRHVLF